MGFSWLRVGKVIGVVVLAAVVLASVYFFVTWRPVKIAWANWVYDNGENYLDCEYLPFYPQVQKSFAEHNDVVNKVRAVSGVVNFYPEQDYCRIIDGGTQYIKGQAVLEYKNRGARRQAESIIGADFFGIPYRGEQVK